MDGPSATHHTDPPDGVLHGVGRAPFGLDEGLADPQWWRDPVSAFAALERAADRDPADRRLAAAVTWAMDRIALDESTPAVVGGVRRVRPIRWDAHSAVWVGPLDGAPDRDADAWHMVRALRPLAASPARHRALCREARALADVTDVEVLETDLGPVLRVRLSGRPLLESVLASDALVRPLLTGLAALRRWEQAGLGLPVPAPDELRLHPAAGVSVVCLWPVRGTVQPALTALASLLLRAVRDRGEDGPDPLQGAIGREGLLARVRALAEHDSTAADAGRLAKQALAEGLAARRHALAAAWRDAQHRSRSARLLEAISRLHDAVPPPSGRGTLGVDPDGEVTEVVSAAGTVRWGPWGEVTDEAEATLVYAPTDGFRPVVARRLLRTRALSPPTPALAGDEARTDAICRWVAAGLKLRTLQLLLQRELG